MNNQEIPGHYLRGWMISSKTDCKVLFYLGLWITMDLDQVSGATTAFYTLHSCDGDMAMKISEILLQQGEQREESWNLLLRDNPSLNIEII